MPINAHPDYLAAEKEYYEAVTLDAKIEKLRKMISLAPGHKGAENLRAELKTRLKKFLEKKEKSKAQGKSRASKSAIKKEDMQAVIVGFSNSGKSSLLDRLTNASPKISPIQFETKLPIVATMNYSNTNVQIIEVPAFDSEYYDKGIVNTADTILILITQLEETNEIEKN